MTSLPLISPSLLAICFCFLSLGSSLPTSTDGARRSALTAWPMQRGGKMIMYDRDYMWEIYLEGSDATPAETRWIMSTLGEWKGRTMSCANSRSIIPITEKAFFAHMANPIKGRAVSMELVWPQIFERVADCFFLMNRFEFVDEELIWKYGGADLDIVFFHTREPVRGQPPMLNLRVHVMSDEKPEAGSQRESVPISNSTTTDTVQVL